MKSYKVIIRTHTPVHIGNGNSITKKDFAIIGDKAKIYDPVKLHSMNPSAYENFMLGNERDSLTDYIKRESKTVRVSFDKALKYEIELGNSRVRKYDNVAEFIKDPYGCPYIPGSSLKGAIRTAILASVVRKKQDSEDRYVDERRQTVAKGAKDIEKKVFGEILESKFRNIKISDSKPLSTKDLLMCKKIDLSVQGNENPINICRESIKPGTEIEFTMSIDGAHDNNWQKPWTAGSILASIKKFNEEYTKNFSEKFSKKQTKNLVEKYSANDPYIYLGGGTGFGTKTINYALYGDEALIKVSEFLAVEFGSRFKPDMHNHKKDPGLGVSPHMLKATEVGSNLLEMGICSIRMIENETI